MQGLLLIVVGAGPHLSVRYGKVEYITMEDLHGGSKLTKFKVR